MAEDHVEGGGLGRFWPIEHYLVYCVVGETEDVIVAELDAELFTESRSLMGKSAYLFLGKVIDVGWLFIEVHKQTTSAQWVRVLGAGLTL